MKKFRTVLVAALACVLVFSLVACGDAGDSATSEGDVDPATIQGEQVTAEQWAKVFDFSAVTNVTFKAVDTRSRDGEKSIRTDIYKYDGDKGYIFSTTTDASVAVIEEQEQFVCKENADVYLYAYDEDREGWCLRMTMNYAHWDLRYILGMRWAENNFDKFTYDSNRQGYVYTTAMGDETDIVKIVNGKLVYTETITSYGEEERSYSQYLYDYDKTSVTLPTLIDD